MKLKRLLFSVSCVVLMTGCSTTDKSSPLQVAKTAVESNGYTGFLYGKAQDRTPSQQRWVVLCRDKHGHEYIVVVDLKGHLMQSVQLGVDGRLTVEQMKELLERQGMKFTNSSPLIPYLSKHNTLYWQFQSHLYSLSGVPYGEVNGLTAFAQPPASAILLGQPLQ